MQSKTVNNQVRTQFHTRKIFEQGLDDNIFLTINLKCINE